MPAEPLGRHIKGNAPRRVAALCCDPTGRIFLFMPYQGLRAAIAVLTPGYTPLSLRDKENPHPAAEAAKQLEPRVQRQRNVGIELNQAIRAAEAAKERKNNKIAGYPG